MVYDPVSLIESFAAIAQEQNFSRAAVRLNIDRSALTRRIQKLEQSVGFVLFERTTREVSLTPAGRRFYEDSADFLRAFETSVHAARRIAEGKTGALRIAYMAFAAVSLMPSAVAGFRSRHPDVEIELSYLPTQAQKIALANDEIDLGFLIGPFDHDDFETRVQVADPLCLAMPKGHPLSSADRVRPSDLASVELILGNMREWEAYRWRISELLSGEGISVRVKFETPDTPALAGLVAAGMGATICPRSLSEFFGDKVDFRTIDHPGFYVETVLAWRRRNRAQIVRHFVAEVCAAVGRAGGP
jgi:DNA-binding transcriptional LysR family regulator